MRVKVIKRFIDKGTMKAHEKGTEFECTEARFKEIQLAGNFVVEIKTEYKAEVKQKGKIEE